MSGGVNDVTITAGILAMLIAIGVALPFIQSDFGVPTTSNTLPDVNTVPTNPIDGISIAISVFNVVFWGFGVMPTWINLILWLFRGMILFIAVRNFVPTLGGG